MTILLPIKLCRSPRGPLLRQDGTVVARVAEEAQEVVARASGGLGARATK